MNIPVQKVVQVIRFRFALLCFLVGAGLTLLPMAQITLAAPLQRPSAVSGSTLIGQLPHQHSAHYLELDTTERDAIISLTLAYDPHDDPNLLGLVNFLVLNEDGLRQYLAGADAQIVNIASGSPMQFDPINNKMRGSFRDSGRGKYTVIVYNNAPISVQYTLFVDGGILTDASGQALSADTAATTQVTTPITETVETAAPNTNVYNAVRARRVSGSLVPKPDRRYLSMEPSIRDGQVDLRFLYDPQDQRDIIGNVNFWVLDEEGLRRMVNGEKADDLNLATGFPVPFSPHHNELQANFAASGHGPYTVVIYNNAELPATYALSIDGGLLIDQYGQTNEAKAAAAEIAALANKAPPVTTVAATVPVTNPITAPAPIDVNSPTTPTTTNFFGVEKLAGALTNAYQNHYMGLTPDRLDGTIGLTLDFDPKDNQAVRENLNFWVLTEDGLRRVISGARPEDLSVAMGMPVQYGVDRGKLSAVFNASGHGKYTVIVFNNSSVPVHYLLTAHGGLLADETGLMASLP